MAISSHDELASRAAGGDEGALTSLFESLGPAILHRIAARIPGHLRSVLTAEDVMQQTYTDAFLGVDTFRGDDTASFGAWLNGIADCNLIDALRMLEAEKRGRAFRRVEPARPDESCLALHELLESDRTTPSRHVAREEACAAIAQAIGRLPEAYRKVVQMYDIEGQPVDVVASALDRRPGAVFMIRARAHRKLSGLLGHASHYLSSP